jgi:hypothetical protein
MNESLVSIFIPEPPRLESKAISLIAEIRRRVHSHCEATGNGPSYIHVGRDTHRVLEESARVGNRDHSEIVSEAFFDGIPVIFIDAADEDEIIAICEV